MVMKNTEMSRPIAGSKENVKSLTRKDLMMFLNYYYNPHNIQFGFMRSIFSDALKIFYSYNKGDT